MLGKWINLLHERMDLHGCQRPYLPRFGHGCCEANVMFDHVCKESIEGKILNLIIVYISCKKTRKGTFAETLLWQGYTLTPHLFHVHTQSNTSFMNSFPH